MILIFCGKYGNNRSGTENVTERTRFPKSRSNDLEDIGQGQRSSHETHLLVLVIICTKYVKNLSRTVDATGRTRKVNGQTARRTDRQTWWIQYSPLTSQRGYKYNIILPRGLFQLRWRHIHSWVALSADLAADTRVMLNTVNWTSVENYKNLITRVLS